MALPAIPAFAEPLKLLPLGDSITQGRGGDQPVYSYRYPLWKLLVDAEVSHDFVGSLQEGFGSSPDWADYRGQIFDRDHEGHWGWTTDGVLGSLPTWLEGYQADMALIFLGTNDSGSDGGLTAEQSADRTAGELESIISLLREDNPSVIILLGGPSQAWDPFPAYRTAYQALAQRLDTEASPVVYVAQDVGWISDPFASGTHTVDWVHPNLAGDTKLAAQWYAAIRNFIPMTFGVWRVGHFSQRILLQANTQPAGDFDLDGVPNLVEYLGDSNPRSKVSVSAMPLEIVDLGTDRVKVRFPVRADATDLVYRVRSGSDLSVFDGLLFDSSVQELPVPDETGHVVVEVNRPLSPQTFLRLELSRS